MASNKIISILMSLFLIQVTYAKPVENNNNSKSIDSTEDTDFSAKQALALYTAINFMALASKYVDETINISRLVLKDEKLLANNKPEVIEFKKNLTKYVENYESSNDMESFYNIDIFSNATEYYLELPKEKETPESVLIVETLNKYEVKDIEKKMEKDFDEFIVQFKDLFEAAKKEMDKPMLDWYEKFLTLKDFEEKFEAFNEFGELN